MRRQFSDTIKFAFDSLISNIHTALPGRIETYEALRKKVSVKPLIKKKFKDGTVLSFPVINNVPVVFPGTRKSVIQYPLEKGDGCLIIFSERSLERYLSSVTEEVEPQDSRKFSISDAVCIPGLFPFNDPGKTTSATESRSMEIIYNNTKITIDSVGNMVLNTGDAFLWKPNVLGVDPFSGIPHGGAGAGIVKLKGD